jgi:hypothetical protein
MTLAVGHDDGWSLESLNPKFHLTFISVQSLSLSLSPFVPMEW